MTQAFGEAACARPLGWGSKSRRLFARTNAISLPGTTSRCCQWSSTALDAKHLADDWRSYERCFYSHNQLKNDDVLARSYLPESTILANVTAWAAAREHRAKLGGWYGIGDPAEPV